MVLSPYRFLGIDANTVLASLTIEAEVIRSAIPRSVGDRSLLGGMILGESHQESQPERMKAEIQTCREEI
jgi:hypothetical protein